MKTKIISIFLILSMLFSLMTIVSYAEEEEIEEDPTVEEERVEDVTIMKEFGSFGSCSSSARERWNKLQPSPVLRTTVSNFMNTGVSVVKTSSTANFYYVKNVGENKTNLIEYRNLVYSQDVFLPASDDEMLAPESIAIKMMNTSMINLVKQENGSFLIKIDGVDKGYLAVGAWFHFDILYSNTSEDKTTAFYTVNIQGSQITSLDGTKATSIRVNNIEKTINPTTSSASQTVINVYLPTVKEEGKTYGVYMNNTWFYVPGDFYSSSVSIPKYDGEKKNNIQLDGVATIKLQHPVDAATFDGTVLVYDSDGNSLTYKSITWDPGNPNYIYISFENNALPKYSTIFFMFPDSTKDTSGKNMESTILSLETYGALNEDYPKLDVVEYNSKTFIMPDPYNTGYRMELVSVGEKYPELAENGFNITDAIAKKYNYEFYGFTYTGVITVSAKQSVSIHDFYQNCTGLYSLYNTGKAMVYISHMEGVGSTAAFYSTGNIHVSYAHIHDCAADILKGASNVTFEFCYFHDAGTRNPGSHADGIQFSGSSSGVCYNTKVIGCRFDMPSMAQEHLANCCFFFKAEDNVAGFSNIQCIGNWLNGGGYTTYLLCEKVGPSNCLYVTYSNNKWGYTHSFGTMVVSGWTGTSDLANYGGAYENNGYVTSLEVGSVVYYDGQKAKRVDDISEITSGSATVLLNFANYLLQAENYKVEYEVLDKDGKVVTRSQVTGTISRNYCSKEYNYEGNWVETTGTNVSGQEVTYKTVKNMPLLPYNVPVEIELTNLPEDLTGYTIAVSVTDTTANKWVRSSTLRDTISENEEEKLPDPADLNVTFQTEDGTTISTVKVGYGKKAAAPTAPTKTGYNFAGWSKSIDNVTEDLIVKATYTIQKFTVTIKGFGGKTLDIKTVDYNKDVTLPTAPTVEGYTFKGWSSDGKNIKSTQTIEAKYEVNYYTVKLYSLDGQTLLEEKKLPYGTSISSITHDLTLPEGYVFAGWKNGSTIDTGTIKGATSLVYAIKIDVSLLKDGADKIRAATSRSEIFTAIKEIQTVLAKWEQDEVESIECEDYTVYLNAVNAYNTIRDNAISDLENAQTLTTNVFNVAAVVAMVLAPLSLAITFRRFF